MLNILRFWGMSETSTTKAKDLIYTTNFVEGSMSVGDLQAWFQTQLSAVSIGVVDGTKFGLITRRHLNQHLVSSSFDKNSKNQSITEIMVQEPLVVQADDSLDNVVGRLCREKIEDEEFFNDIVVLDAETFMGLLSVREALTNHVENISHLLTATLAQKQALSNKNKQLFDNNFKSGFMGSQFKMLFEQAYLPMLYFTEEGKLDVFNRRFTEMSGIPRQHLEDDAMFGQLFDLSYSKVLESACQQRDLMSDENGFMREVTLKQRAGNTMKVTAYFEATADKRRLMINILSAGESEEIQEEPLENIYDITPEQGQPGKITQAINTKLVNEQAMGLARSVASNLIDREQSLDRLMNKLDSVMKVAEQIEGMDGAASGNDSGNLSGSLADFSMIDLCQILSQGNKTGCLNIENGQTGQIGKMFFNEGQIIHGYSNEGYEGVESLPALLGMRTGDFIFQLGEQPDHVTIEGDTMGLLMEACQNLDES